MCKVYGSMVGFADQDLALLHVRRKYMVWTSVDLKHVLVPCLEIVFYDTTTLFHDKTILFHDAAALFHDTVFWVPCVVQCTVVIV